MAQANNEGYIKQLASFSTANTGAFDISELTPSQVFDAATIAALKKKKSEAALKKKNNINKEEVENCNPYGFQFDSKKGYIVPGDDPAILASCKIPQEEIDKILQRQKAVKPISDAEVAKAEMANMSTSRRDAVNRFSNI